MTIVSTHSYSDNLYKEQPDAITTGTVVGLRPGLEPGGRDFMPSGERNAAGGGTSSARDEGTSSLYGKYIVLPNLTVPDPIATTSFRPLQMIETELRAICKDAESEIFEAGIESDFSKEFIDFILKYGNLAIDAFDNLLSKINISIACEALLCLGDVEQPETYNRRLQLLQKSLYGSSPRIRSNAISGIAALKAEDAIPALQMALQREQAEWLRNKMEQVLKQLESILEWH